MKGKMPDWAVRALKTFVQAFGGVLIPEVVMVLQGKLPESFSGWTAVLTPIVCAALAAGISAAWNIISQNM